MAFSPGIDVGCIGTLVERGSEKYVESGVKVFKTGLDIKCFPAMMDADFDDEYGYDDDVLTYDGDAGYIAFGSAKYVADGAKVFTTGLDCNCFPSMATVTLAAGKYVSEGTKSFKAGSIEVPCFGLMVEIAKPFADQDTQSLIPIF
jgi:hypothetical protein